MALQLGMMRMQQPRRPKVVAPPGAFVPGMGFSRSPVTEEDLAMRDQAGLAAQEQAAAPPTGVGVRTPHEFSRRPPPAASERMRPRTEQITEDLYFDPSISPEGRARTARESQADELSAGLGSLAGLPPDQVAGLRRYVAAGGDPGDYLTYKRGIDTQRTTPPPRFTDEAGNLLERDPDTGDWVPARRAGGAGIRGQQPMQIITGPGGEYTRVPTRGPSGPIGVQRPPTEGELTREQKVQANRTLMREIEVAIDLVKANSGSFGLQNAVSWIPKAGSPLLSMIDPKGIEARAAVQDIVGALMYSRLGSAQSAGELMRAEGWAASTVDPAGAVLTKLNRLVERLERETQGLSRVGR